MIFYQVFYVVAILFMFTTVQSIQHGNTKSSSAVHQTPKPTHGSTEKSFTLHQAPNSYSRSGPAHMLSAYHRLNVPPPRRLKSIISAKGTVTASPVALGQLYLTTSTIGEQTFDVPFDTGAFDFWITTWAHFPELLWSKRLKLRKWGMDNQMIGAVTYIEKTSKLPEELDGYFGLSTNHASTNFFNNIKSSLLASLFTAELKRGIPGSYDFGFIDHTKYRRNTTYVPVNTSLGYWEFDVNGYAIGRDNNINSINIFIDTGTSIIYLPDQIVHGYYAAVSKATYDPTQDGYVFPCGTALPDLTLVIGDYEAVAPGYFFEYSALGLTCYGGIQSLGNWGPLCLSWGLYLSNPNSWFSTGTVKTHASDSPPNLYKILLRIQFSSHLKTILKRNSWKYLTIL